MESIGELYAEGRRRISEIAAGLDAAAVDRPVPACSGWTAHDVVAHLAGICTDTLAGQLDGVTTAAWADGHVRDRRDRTMNELLEEWSLAAPGLENAPDRFPEPLGTVWVLDLTAHEHDFRGAVDRPGARDAPAVRLAIEFLLWIGIHPMLVGHGLEALSIRTPCASWVVGASTDVGHGRPEVDRVPTLACPTFELFRALTGRRSRAQIARFDWSSDPEPFLPAFEFGTFTTRTTDLHE